MDWTVDEGTAKELLSQYSEWLDTEGLVTPGSETHADLIAKFLEQRNPLARPKVLP